MPRYVFMVQTGQITAPDFHDFINALKENGVLFTSDSKDLSDVDECPVWHVNFMRL